MREVQAAPGPKENRMEIAPVVPDWLTWLAAGGVGALALAAVARILEAMLDLEQPS